MPHEPGAGGGLSTFLALFEDELAAREIEVVRTPDEACDAMLIPAWATGFAWLWDAKRMYPTMRIAHRIDGSARDYGRRDGSDRRQARVNMLADVTIFQSAYGRHATTRKFRVIHQDGPVVHNPVDLARFHPATRRSSGRLRVLHVAHSTNALKGMADLNQAALRTDGCDFTLVGRYERPPDRPHIRAVGELRGLALAEAYRDHDLLVTFSRNDTCPNVVLEALASGLGVLHLDSGGIPELVGDCGRIVSVESLPEVIEGLGAAVRCGDMAARARARAEAMFSPAAIVDRYLEVMAHALARALPTYREWLELFCAGYPVGGCCAAERARAWLGRVRRRLRQQRPQD